MANSSSIYYPLRANFDQGAARQRSYGVRGVEYKLINYDKEEVKNENKYSSVFAYRSVVVKGGVVLSMAPSRSISFDQMKERHLAADIIVEEFVEGTMVNAFWCDGWQIATRNGVGCDYGFFSTRSQRSSASFKDMFEEASKRIGLVLSTLNKNTCYSFVLQHPKNPLVFLHEQPDLYCVQAFEMDTPGVDGTTNAHPISHQELEASGIFNGTQIKYPKQFDTIRDFDDVYNALMELNGTNIMGLVLKSIENDDRCKMRTPTYQFARQLRGNTASLLPQYLTVRMDNRIKEFLFVFPHFKGDFEKYAKCIVSLEKELYTSYVKAYIRNKCIGHSDLLKHMRVLHRNYKNSAAHADVDVDADADADEGESEKREEIQINRKRKRVNRLAVVSYLNCLPQGELVKLVLNRLNAHVLRQF